MATTRQVNIQSEYLMWTRSTGQWWQQLASLHQVLPVKTKGSKQLKKLLHHHYIIRRHYKFPIYQWQYSTKSNIRCLHLAKHNHNFHVKKGFKLYLNRIVGLNNMSSYDLYCIPMLQVCQKPICWLIFVCLLLFLPDVFQGKKKLTFPFFWTNWKRT